jgi:hypothetical protein
LEGGLLPQMGWHASFLEIYFWNKEKGECAWGDIKFNGMLDSTTMNGLSYLHSAEVKGVSREGKSSIYL